MKIVASGTAVARFSPVRRFFALLAFLLVLALAATLLYRVYLHHEAAEPYEEADSVSVELRVKTAHGSA